MITFRFHRGSLEESMKTCVTFNDLYMFIEYLAFYTNFHDFYGTRFPKTIEFKFYADEDSRIGWKPVYLILVDDRPCGFATGDVHIMKVKSPLE